MVVMGVRQAGFALDFAVVSAASASRGHLGAGGLRAEYRRVPEAITLMALSPWWNRVRGGRSFRSRPTAPADRHRPEASVRTSLRMASTPRHEPYVAGASSIL